MSSVRIALFVGAAALLSAIAWSRLRRGPVAAVAALALDHLSAGDLDPAGSVGRQEGRQYGLQDQGRTAGRAHRESMLPRAKLARLEDELEAVARLELLVHSAGLFFLPHALIRRVPVRVGRELLDTLVRM